MTNPVEIVPVAWRWRESADDNWILATRAPKWDMDAGHQMEPLVTLSSAQAALTAAQARADEAEVAWRAGLGDTRSLETCLDVYGLDYMQRFHVLAKVSALIEARAQTLSAQLADTVKALNEVRKRTKSARGAIESNQVVDKDVRGSLTWVLETIDAALAKATPTPEFPE